MGVNATNSNIFFGVKIPIPGKEAIKTKFEIKIGIGFSTPSKLNLNPVNITGSFCILSYFTNSVGNKLTILRKV